MTKKYAHFRLSEKNLEKLERLANELGLRSKAAAMELLIEAADIKVRSEIGLVHHKSLDLNLESSRAQ